MEQYSENYLKFWEKSAKISLQKHMEVIMMKLVSMLLTLCMVFLYADCAGSGRRSASCEAGRGYDRDL